MYSIPENIKEIPVKWSLMFLFTFSLYAASGQSKKINDEAVYIEAFNQLKSNPYNKKLISLSDTVPEKKWNNYKGGPIHTPDSGFYFNNDLLCHYFPTNSSKISNQYLIIYFSQKESKCPTLFSLLNYYQHAIDTYLKQNKLPKELNLIPVICSAFDPYSSNGIGGEGFWHLNYPQAIKYGLTVNEWVDERRDFEKSTRAATRYISDLHQMYNDWELTLAAYSSGVTTVNKLLKRHSAKTYKEIYPYLPNETRDMVQAFVAMNYIYHYDNYGAVQLNPVIDADTVMIERKLMYEAINKVIKINIDQLSFLNPTVNQKTFPGNYLAYFPKGKKEQFITMKDSIYFYQDSVLLKPKPKEPEFVIPKNGETIEYKVKSGDVLGLIAQRFNVKVSQIQAWNNLNGTRINVGQKLVIYGKPKHPEYINNNEDKKDGKTEPAPEPVIETNDYTTYTVKSGDNLWLIAKNFPGISSDDIMQFNDIDEDLQVGQVLKIPKP